MKRIQCLSLLCKNKAVFITYSANGIPIFMCPECFLKRYEPNLRGEDIKIIDNKIERSIMYENN